MSTDRSYIAKNDAERERLRALVTRATEADLSRPMPAGWTVASVLGHLAFWDQRVLTLLDAWDLGVAPPASHQDDVDWINDAGKPFLLALPPLKAAELALTIAEAADGRVAALTDAQHARLASGGHSINLLRAEHRKEHLDEIEGRR